MAGKGPLNYTTEVDPEKTAAECVALLAKHGAKRVSIDFDGEGMAQGLAFSIDTAHGLRFFLLPSNPEGVYEALKRANRRGDIPPRYVNITQAKRTAWRVLKVWLEAELALIEAQIVDLEQVMLPYLVVDDSGMTLYQRYLDHGRKMLEGAE